TEARQMSGPVPSPSMKGTTGWSGTFSLPWEIVIFSPEGIFTRPGMLPPQGAGPAHTVRTPDRAAVRGGATSLRERVQGRPGAEPADVLVGQAVASLDRDRPAVRLVDTHLDGPAGREARESRDAHPIHLLEQVVVLGVRERQRQDPLLLQIRLVDAREALDQSRSRSEVPWGHRGGLAARSLAVVLVADDDPADVSRLPVPGDPGERHGGLAGQHVHAFAGLARERVEGPEEHVVADPVEVAAE